jgi:hypothetical protein
VLLLRAAAGTFKGEREWELASPSLLSPTATAPAVQRSQHFAPLFTSPLVHTVAHGPLEEDDLAFQTGVPVSCHCFFNRSLKLFYFNVACKGSRQSECCRLLEANAILTSWIAQVSSSNTCQLPPPTFIAGFPRNLSSRQGWESRSIHLSCSHL